MVPARQAETMVEKKLLWWCRRGLRRAVASLEGSWDGSAGTNYVPLLEDGGGVVKMPPKGHVVVYVGGEEERERVFVRVEYVNHPLFAKLMEDAEYGLNGGGGITVPCTVSEFEEVRSRIAATSGAVARRGSPSKYRWVR